MPTANQSEFTSQGVNTSESTLPETNRSKSHITTKNKKKTSRQLIYIFLVCRCKKNGGSSEYSSSSEF